MKKIKVIPFTYDEFKGEVNSNDYEISLLKQRNEKKMLFHLSVNDKDVDYNSVSPVSLAVTIKALRQTCDRLTDMLQDKIGIPEPLDEDNSLLHFLEDDGNRGYDELYQYDVLFDDGEDSEELIESGRAYKWLKAELEKEHQNMPN